MNGCAFALECRAGAAIRVTGLRVPEIANSDEHPARTGGGAPCRPPDRPPPSVIHSQLRLHATLNHVTVVHYCARPVPLVLEEEAVAETLLAFRMFHIALRTYCRPVVHDSRDELEGRSSPQGASLQARLRRLAK